MRLCLKLRIKLLAQCCVISSSTDKWLKNQDSVHVHFSSEEWKLCWTQGSLIKYFCKISIVEKMSKTVSPKKPGFTVQQWTAISKRKEVSHNRTNAGWRGIRWHWRSTLCCLALQCGMSESSTHTQTEPHKQNFRVICYDNMTSEPHSLGKSCLVWITGSRCFKGTWCLHLHKSWTSRPFKLNASCSFQTSGTSYPVTQCHIPEEQPSTTPLWKHQRITQYDSTAWYMSNIIGVQVC
jgi:hypothetical protein